MRLPIHQFRIAKRRLKRAYIVRVRKRGKGLFIPMPNDLVKAFRLEVGDVAIFKVISKKKFIVVFVKGSVYSFVEKV